MNAALLDAYYLPALYNRGVYIDITAKAAADLEIARAWDPGTIKDSGSRGGTEKDFRKLQPEPPINRRLVREL